MSDSDNPYVRWQNSNVSNSSNPLLYAGSNGVNDGTKYHQQTLKVLQDNGFNDESIILDYGCGCGALYSAVKDSLVDPTSQYFGNEMSSEAYVYLLENFSIQNLFLSKSDLINDFTDQIFDYLVAFSVFNHMDIDRFDRFIENLEANIHNESKFLFTVRLISKKTTKPKGILSECGRYYNDRSLNYGYKDEEFFTILESHGYDYEVVKKNNYYDKKILGDLDLILISKKEKNT
jgi:hypothetical protein